MLRRGVTRLASFDRDRTVTLDNQPEDLLRLFGTEHLHGGDIWGAARHLGRHVEDILDLSASLNPLGPPPGMQKVIIDALGRLCNYPDRRAFELREHIAAKLGLTRFNVLAGNGSTSMIRLLARSMELRDIMVLAPVFGEFTRALAAAGRHFRYYNLDEADGFALTARHVDKIMAQNPPALVLTNPATPSGALTSPEVMESLYRQAKRRNTWLILDEAFIDFAPAESRNWSPPRILEYPRLIVLRSMTKFYCLAGLRLGYALAQRDVLAEMVPLGEPWSVNTLAQAAGVFCLDQDDFGDKTRATVERLRKQQTDELSALGLDVLPSQANYLLCRLPAGGPTAQQVAEYCFYQGVLVRDASSFMCCGDRHFRVAVTARRNHQRMIEALRGALASND